VKVPLSLFVFDKKLGPAELLVKYLKENVGLRIGEIAELLGRKHCTISITYRNASRKKKAKIEIKDIGKEKIMLPISLFAGKLSVLESLIENLKERGMKNIEIAKLLERDPRNIMTLDTRAREKLK